MEILTFITILAFIAIGTIGFEVIKTENYTRFIGNSTEDFKKFFNLEEAVDYFNNTPIPSPNCFSASIDNPSLLIYCLIIALIWLATVATGLFFYFRAIFHKLTNKSNHLDIELQPIIKNGLEADRKNIMGK